MSPVDRSSDLAEREQRLERLIDRALRSQPALHAPADLQARVFAEIERRAALPWWHKSFSYWPLAARVAFLLISLGFVKVAVSAAMWALTPIESAAQAAQLPAQMTWLSAVASSIVLVLRAIPSQWIYGVALLLGALYFVVFGVGAAAYRTLYASR